LILVGSEMQPLATPISEELASFLESGISILVGTRDAQRRPTAMRAMGASVAADRRTVTIFLPEQTAARTLANLALEDGGRIAVTFSRPSDYRSLQIKGRCLGTRRTTEEERTKLESYSAAFVVDLEVVGLARQLTERLTSWPSIALQVAIEDLYEQTPGPGAGQKLDGAP
ncbi:MAG: hypothetical protein QOI41_6463, partial [Myxococcales bacterium]|nr:hypothetical protein [Myxococcales bacterium]